MTIQYLVTKAISVPSERREKVSYVFILLSSRLRMINEVVFLRGFGIEENVIIYFYIKSSLYFISK